MRVPVDWLHEYCRPELGTVALADRLTMTGTNVEAIVHHGVAALDRFVVGKVLESNRHPDADRLTVNVVDVGEPGSTTIVCGAPNVAAGQTVAIARPGAVMPDGSELGKAKLRGVESDGMILAEDELGISTDHNEIIVLDPERGLTPGEPLAAVLPISSDVLELEITSNRPDCLSVYGVAREVHAATGAALDAPPWAEDPGSAGAVEGSEVVVECPDLCARFTARLFDDVKIGPSPIWLKARLMAAGQRPISNVVDITNYVMLLTGQPLHAFDFDRVAGGKLTVRLAQDGEQVTTLDGQTRTLDDRMMLIADADGPTSIAGVMGGERSEVHDATTRVLMEAANWDGPTIHHTAWTLGLQSEASGRFEKQLQPELASEAQALATRLMIELCGARLAPGTIDVGSQTGPPAQTIRLREARIAGLLGSPIARDRAAEILEALEFEVQTADDGLDVTVPFFRRGDVTREADLIEEVARIDGLEKLPATLPSRDGASGRLTAQQRLRRRAADALTAQALHEIVGWSFTGPELAERLRLSDRGAIELENPMSGDQSLLRTTLLGSLLDATSRNRARGAASVRLFEAGAVYLPSDEQLPKEPYRVGALLTGPVRTATWRDAAPRNADFFAAKGVLTGLLETLRVPWTVDAAAQPFLHPGRTAQIVVAGEPAGWLGELHPLIARAWDLEETVAGFELDLDIVAAHAPGAQPYEDLTSFPAVREDLAIVVGDDVTAAQVLAVVRAAGEPLLAGAEVFDVYRGEQAGEGNVSLALRLTYRAPDRTLTDEEVATRRRAIGKALLEDLGGGSVPPDVAVFGAGGYTGALAARLLYRHPTFLLRSLTARSDAGRTLDELYPYHRVPLELEELDLDRHAEVDAAIVAYPHGAAAELVVELRDRGVRVVDLSADFRLRDPAVYADWYREHPAPERLAEAVYGLPELYREAIAGSDIVANPGCYPTAAILALAPLARAGLIEELVIDAKSGVSGAGRSATDATHFVSVDENVSAYGVPRHRHTPEIEQELAELGAEVTITFTPHLLPLDQGELVSCYVTAADGTDVVDLEALYYDAYANEPFVELAVEPPGVRAVRETNLCRISVHRDERTGRVIVFGAIDNLWKGAASQAVQNLNLMFGLDEREGIS